MVPGIRTEKKKKKKKKMMMMMMMMMKMKCRGLPILFPLSDREPQ